MASSVKLPSEQALTVQYVLDQLQADGIVTAQQIAQFLDVLTRDDRQHPLVTVSDLALHSNSRPSYPLTLDQLTRWLAKKTGQEYFRVDPLKIDVARVTGVVSQAYANNLKILPVIVSETELTVATCEPFIHA